MRKGIIIALIILMVYIVIGILLHFCKVKSTVNNAPELKEFVSYEIQTFKYVKEGIISKTWLCERLVQKGLPFEDVDRALKIVHRESRFTENAINVNKNKSIDRGLFQINSVHELHEEFDLLNAEDNVEAFYLLYTKYGFKPWKWLGGIK